MTSKPDHPDRPPLWERFNGALEGFVRNRIADPDAAEDVQQDIYLKLHDRAASLRDQDKVTGWVFTVARNTVIDHYRARGRQRQQPVGVPRVADRAPSPEDELTGPQRTWDALVDCLPALLGELSDEYREAIELVELGGLTRREAAEQVGISESGMKSRVQRARAQMADRLHDWCDLALDARGTPINCTPRTPDADDR